MEQDYPLRSYATDHLANLDNDVSSPSASWQQYRSESAFTVQRKPLPHVYERNVSGYQPLNESRAGHESPSLQKTGRSATTSTSMKWWLPELIASFIAVACLVSIIIVLHVYDGRLLSDINLPATLTLNGIIAAISTLARVAFMVPVASGLSQESWIWFSNNNNQQHQCRSQLKDLDMSDDASRGAWGSLMFLLTARRRWLAYVGALVTILSLGFGTFTQQLLAIDQFSLGGESDSAPGNLPRAETWLYESIRPSEGVQSLPLDLRAALYNGMLLDKVDPIIATCATGNCTWPITPSLAICGGCSETSYIRSCDSHVCNYTMQSGTQMSLSNQGDGYPGFQVNSSSQGSIYNGSNASRIYVVHFDAVGAPYETPSGHFYNKNVTSSECALWMCIQSFQTSMVAGKLRQNVTMEFSDIKTPPPVKTGYENYTFLDLPSEMNPSPATVYNVSEIGAECFHETLRRSFNGSVNLDQAGYHANSDGVEAIWNASSNLDPWIKNVAESLTNGIRYVNTNPHPRSYVGTLYPPPRRSIYDGKAQAFGIKVQWYWLTLPVICIMISLLFQALIMIKTAESTVAPWKSSLLAFLFFEADQELKQRVSGRMKEWHGVLDAVGDERVALREDHRGKWAFKTA